MALVLEGAVAQLAQAVEEDGAGERVAGLALVEDAAGAAALLGVVEPVEHEQGALDPTDLAQATGRPGSGAGKPASLRSMTEALTVPARIEAASRSVSSQCSSMARTLTGPATSGRSVGQGSSGDRRTAGVR